MSPATSPIIGIDLGTTYSACAYFDEGAIQLVDNPLGESLTPSVVAFDERRKSLVTGRTAKDVLAIKPQLGAARFKRAMGTDRRYKIAGEDYSPTELSAHVLDVLRQDAQEALGCLVKRCVITVPAYFNEAQRFATKRAGELAGFHVERVLNEPTAAAIAYGLHRADDEMTFLVFDLESVAVYVACVAVWEHPKRATQLFDKYAGSPQRGSLAEKLHLLYHHLSGMSEAWQSVVSQAPPPQGLVRFLSLAPVSDDDRLTHLAGERIRGLDSPDNQAKDVLKRRRAYFATLDAMIEQDGALIEILCSVTTDVSPGPRPGDSGPVSQAQETACVSQIRKADRSLRRQRSFLRGAYQSFIGFYLILGIPAFLLIQGWLKGGALGLAIAVLLFVPYRWFDRRFYRRHVRLRALDVIRTTQVKTDRLAELIKEHEGELEAIDEFNSEIEDDEALSILGAWIRLGAQAS